MERVYRVLDNGVFNGLSERSKCRPWGLQGGSPGVLQGAYSYVLQDNDGQIASTHSVSAGLDYAAIGPEHALLHGCEEHVGQPGGLLRNDGLGQVLRGGFPRFICSHNGNDHTQFGNSRASLLVLSPPDAPHASPTSRRRRLVDPHPEFVSAP